MADEKQEPQSFVLFPSKRVKWPKFAQSFTNSFARKRVRTLLQNAGNVQSSRLLNLKLCHVCFTQLPPRLFSYPCQHGQDFLDWITFQELQQRNLTFGVEKGLFLWDMSFLEVPFTSVPSWQTPRDQSQEALRWGDTVQVAPRAGPSAAISNHTGPFQFLERPQWHKETFKSVAHHTSPGHTRPSVGIYSSSPAPSWFCPHGDVQSLGWWDKAVPCLAWTQALGAGGEAGSLPKLAPDLSQPLLWLVELLMEVHPEREDLLQIQNRC